MSSVRTTLATGGCFGDFGKRWPSAQFLKVRPPRGISRNLPQSKNPHRHVSVDVANKKGSSLLILRVEDVLIS